MTRVRGEMIFAVHGLTGLLENEAHGEHVGYITGLRQVIQDMVAPDLKALTAKLEALQQQTEMLQILDEFPYESILTTFEAFRAEMRSELTSLRAKNQIQAFRQLSPLSESVAGLETRTK